MRRHDTTWRAARGLFARFERAAPQGLSTSRLAAFMSKECIPAFAVYPVGRALTDGLAAQWGPYYSSDAGAAAAPGMLKPGGMLPLYRISPHGTPAPRPNSARDTRRKPADDDPRVHRFQACVPMRTS